MKVLTLADKVERMEATAVFVSFDRSDTLERQMLSGIDELRFPVLVDVERTAYRAWGLRRASVATVWLDPRVWRSYARLLLGGERIRGRGSDTLQLGGDFVVDEQGIVVYSRPQERDDRPAVHELIRALPGTARWIERGRPRI